ncbi:uncharacterized protein LOC110978461 isoform X2 [Acanthaster planci]|uniref:Uncharacterized protein LOC110978461 isoform X2 n=1 Tax=Acanthaster planci TaxID=133434 RepID=A0A8B7Y7H4_ACAPL|nr:uncharacterized protein LOC110978461 isoform X2 [Acanthaster planci]
MSVTVVIVTPTVSKVNQWLTLKRKASTLPVVSSHTCSSGGSSRDVNGSHDVQLSKHQDHAVDAGELPSDPRLWSPYDVTAWLSRMEESHGLDVDHSFFQMNGRGLCLMPLKGFLFRVPDHGGLLYEDFRGRLRKCLLMPGDETSGPTANKRTESTAHRGGATSQSGYETAQWPLPPVAKCGEVVVAEETSVPDFKGRVSPLTYHTL